MDFKSVVNLINKYGYCPKCGNTMIGNGEGSIESDENSFTRSCKCGFKITVDKDNKVINK